MSLRARRLEEEEAGLRTQLQIANIRLNNAINGLSSLPQALEPQRHVYEAELAAAQDALSSIKHELSRNVGAFVASLQRHGEGFRDGSFIYVESGPKPGLYEYEDPGTGSPGWRLLENGLPVGPRYTFEEVAYPEGEPDFYRLYTSEEVDDLLEEQYLAF